jgi:hypothetical protein
MEPHDPSRNTYHIQKNMKGINLNGAYKLIISDLPKFVETYENLSDHYFQNVVIVNNCCNVAELVSYIQCESLILQHRASQIVQIVANTQANHLKFVHTSGVKFDIKHTSIKSYKSTDCYGDEDHTYEDLDELIKLSNKRFKTTKKAC